MYVSEQGEKKIKKENKKKETNQKAPTGCHRLERNVR